MAYPFECSTYIFYLIYKHADNKTTTFRTFAKITEDCQRVSKEIELNLIHCLAKSFFSVPIATARFSSPALHLPYFRPHSGFGSDSIFVTYLNKVDFLFSMCYFLSLVWLRFISRSEDKELDISYHNADPRTKLSVERRGETIKYTAHSSSNQISDILFRILFLDIQSETKKFTFFHFVHLEESASVEKRDVGPRNSASFQHLSTFLSSVLNYSRLRFNAQ